MAKGDSTTAPAPPAAGRPDATPGTRTTKEYALLFCGSTRWDMLGRKTLPKSVAQRGGSERGEELWAPTRVRFGGLAGVRFVSVYAGCAAAHWVVVDEAGRAYGVGRNDCGQLGRGDLRARRHAVELGVPLGEGERVVGVACGRVHTLVVGSGGGAWAVGGNASGQLGIGRRGEERKGGEGVGEWGRVGIGERVVGCAAGGEFSVWWGESGRVWAAGSGQYGQLGNGRTGECIRSNNRMAFDVMAVPVRVAGFGDGEGEVKCVQVACGVNHSVALDERGKVWSWGFGGYGRLGHKTPKDELRPRRIEVFDVGAYRLDMVSCGQQSSFATQGNRKSCYMWGMTKRTGESAMYPKPNFDLQGWLVRSIGCGSTSVVVAAERSVISWGSSPTFGELGYGEGNAKSSTKPKMMEAVEGLVTKQVAVGVAFTVLLVEVETEEDRKIVERLGVLGIEGSAEADETGGEGGKRRSENGSGQGSRKRSKKRK